MNTATVVSDIFDNNTGNNTDTVTTNVIPTADLRVVKTASTGLIYSGTIVVYTINYENLGNSNATGVTITDILPAEITFISASAGAYSGAVHRVFLTGIILNDNQTGVLVITGIGNANITSGLTIINTGTITSSIFDPNTTNNTSRTIGTGKENPVSDLSISKTANTGIAYS